MDLDSSSQTIVKTSEQYFGLNERLKRELQSVNMYMLSEAMGK